MLFMENKSFSKYIMRLMAAMMIRMMMIIVIAIMIVRVMFCLVLMDVCTSCIMD